MKRAPIVFEHQGFKFVQQAILKKRSLNGGTRAWYSEEYPPQFAFWGGHVLTAKQIVRCIGALKR